LGSAWLEKDFHPLTDARNKSDGYRLLILDGHNSHVTYRFCKFAADKKIIVIRLPAHTTHVLQPCDVGVFGPLASAWKSEVLEASRRNDSITKNNLLKHYANARSRAMKPNTIVNSFRKTGIWPLDRTAIPSKAFAPSLNTTTEAAPPLPIQLPSILTPIPTAPDPNPERLNGMAPSNITAQLQPSAPPPSEKPTQPPGAQYVLIDLPPPLPFYASREALRKQNEALHKVALSATQQIERNHAQMVLMKSDNENLRKQLFSKSQKRKKKEVTGLARHMTAQEALDELAHEVWVSGMKEVFKEAGPRFKALRKDIDDYYRKLAQAIALEEKQRQQAEQAAARQQKIDEHEAERQRKLEERQQKAEEREIERQRKVKEREMEREGKAREREAERKRKADKRAELQHEKAKIRAQKAAAKKHSGKGPVTPMKGRRNERKTYTPGRGKNMVIDEVDESSGEEFNFDASTETAIIPTHPRSWPKPRPIRKSSNQTS
jgi:DDE superfamily endonuclease